MAGTGDASGKGPTPWMSTDRRRASSDEAGEDGDAAAPRYSRRLSDKILIAFHHACDQADFEVAEQLLHILEMMLTRRPLRRTAPAGATWRAWSPRMSGCGTCGIPTRSARRAAIPPAAIVP